MGVFQAAFFLLASFSLFSQPAPQSFSLAPTASAFFFNIPLFSPLQPRYMQDSAAMQNPDYAFFNSLYSRYSAAWLNSKPPVTSCLSRLHSAGFNSVQINAMTQGGQALFSAYGFWGADGKVQYYGRAYSSMGASITLSASAKEARKWIESKDAGSAVSAFAAGGISVQPAWAKYVLPIAASECFKVQ